MKTIIFGLLLAFLNIGNAQTELSKDEGIAYYADLLKKNAEVARKSGEFVLETKYEYYQFDKKQSKLIKSEWCDKLMVFLSLSGKGLKADYSDRSRIWHSGVAPFFRENAFIATDFQKVITGSKRLYDDETEAIDFSDVLIQPYDVGANSINDVLMTSGLFFNLKNFDKDPLMMVTPMFPYIDNLKVSKTSDGNIDVLKIQGAVKRGTYDRLVDIKIKAKNTPPYNLYEFYKETKSREKGVADSDRIKVVLEYGENAADSIPSKVTYEKYADDILQRKLICDSKKVEYHETETVNYSEVKLPANASVKDSRYGINYRVGPDSPEVVDTVKDWLNEKTK